MKFLKKIFSPILPQADSSTAIEKRQARKVRFNKNRSIRIFISSTFQDMQEERDVLIKHIFPQLRKLCMKRGVSFSEVDLRWGVTREQAERGEVLPVCLAEIENCRPYFLGILGDRYGWVPGEIPENLVENQSWLKDYQQRSVTELEIVHGVLNKPEMAGHAFFYFRSPTPLIDENQDKLEALKDRIRQSGFPVKENYPDPKTVGQWILDDLKGVIEKEYPQKTLTMLERNRLDHEVFAESRAKVYIGRQEYFDQLDEHVAGNGKPLVIIGESGCGKSSLLANWHLNFQDTCPEKFCLIHFIGSSSDSTDYINLLRRIMAEIKERYEFTLDIPNSSEEILAQFPNWLSMAAGRGPLILILDGLNQLEDKDNACELFWLPEYIPAEVRLIVSTLPGPSQDELNNRKWPFMEVQPLELAERTLLIEEYLFKLYSKKLSDDLVDRIVRQPQCSNPLFLHALLEELRVFGKHEELDNRINHYMEAENPEKLYEKVLSRLEEDFEKERPGLVGEALSLIWASRRGLSEQELMEILDMPQLQWSPLSLSLQDSLVNRSGALNFFHDFLRQAVHSKYLKTREDEHRAHLLIADYFEDKELGSRKIDELPWQLMESHEWQRLHDHLADLSFFNAAFDHAESDVLIYWQKVQHNSDLTSLNAYRKVLSSPQDYLSSTDSVSYILSIHGYLIESLSLKNYLTEHFSARGEMSKLAWAIGSMAGVYKDLGEIDKAQELYEKSERIFIEKKEIISSLNPLIDRAQLLQERGELDTAMILYKRHEDICTMYSRRRELALSYSGQGTINKLRGNLEAAMDLYVKEEKIHKELNDLIGLANSYGNQAIIMEIRGELDKTLNLLEKEKELFEKLGYKSKIALNLGHMAIIFQALDRLDEAMKLHLKQEHICREIRDKKGLARSLSDQALIHKAWGNLDQALLLHKEEEALVIEMDYKLGLALSLGRQAIIYNMQGHVQEALRLHKEEETICREINYPEGLQLSLGNQGVVYQEQGDFITALQLHAEKAAICKKIGNISSLSFALFNQARIHAFGLNQIEKGLELIEQAYLLASNHGLIANSRQILPVFNQIKEMSENISTN